MWRRSLSLVRILTPLAGVAAVAGAACAAPVTVALPLDRPAVQSPLAAQSVLLVVRPTLGGWIAAGERGHVLVSSSEAKDWRQAAVPVSTTLTAVTESSRGVLLAVGHGLVILRSPDRGATWSRVMDGRQLAIAFAEATRKAEKAGRASLATRLARLSREGPDKPLLDVIFISDSMAIAVGAYGVILSSADAGVTWSVDTDAMPDDEDGHLNAVRRIGTTVWIVGEGGRLYRSVNDGRNFDRIESPARATLFTITGQGNTLLAAGLRGNAVASMDGGRSWQTVTTGTTNSFTAATPVGSRDGVIVGDDRGGLWHLVPGAERLVELPLRGRYPIADLAVDGGEILTVGPLGIEKLGRLFNH